MKLKNNKIKHIVWACEIAFSCLILLFLYFTQILLLDKYYKIYKTRILNEASSLITTNEDIRYDDLEDIAYKYGICISMYTNNEFSMISNSFNRGCFFDQTNIKYSKLTEFIESSKKEDTIILKNDRFNNLTLIKGIKLDYNNYIFLNTSIEPLDASIVLLKSQYIYIIIIVLLLSILVGYVISNQISKPITEISSSAKRMANGNFNVSFKSNSKIYEIAELSEILEKAKNELSKTDELRKDLLANVGHDLKTPLTMIKAYAEMTRDLENQPAKKKKENLNIIIEETDRLAALVNDILDLSKVQSRTCELEIEEFDLDTLIKKIINRYDIVSKTEGYTFVYNSIGKTMVKADKKRIEQVIYNLINNAINYTGNDKIVEVVVESKNKKTRVEVKDTGKGIKEEEITLIWDKYYHNEKKHKRNSHGTGLGLTIVKNILEQHNFKYGVSSKIDNGTTFYFEINK